MPAEEPPRFLQSVHIEYPDDDSTKDVYLQAASLSYPGYGDRHVLIWWLNASCDEEDDALQVIQLTGQAGNYHYFFPVVERSPASLRASNQQFVLGTFTRAQREQILNLADEVAFSRTSTVNSCRVWTRDLLEAMLKAGLITAARFKEVDEGVPLKHRVPEA